MKKILAESIPEKKSPSVIFVGASGAGKSTLKTTTEAPVVQSKAKLQQQPKPKVESHDDDEWTVVHKKENTEILNSKLGLQLHLIMAASSTAHDIKTIHKTKPDFGELAKLFPSLEKHVFQSRSGFSLNWKDPSAVRELNVTLLAHWYSLSVTLPPDHLCPTVTSRANYIQWLAEELCVPPGSPTDTVRGMDIGTGASCIYPLLGTRIYNWNFVATDVDESSLEWARKNVCLNKFENFIELRSAKSDHVLLSGIRDSEKYHFTMCNPPFFSGMSSAKSASTGTESEMVTYGGEIAFVSNMISDSLELKDRVKWYTSLLGCKSSLKPLIQHLRDHHIYRIKTTQLLQGKTTRWVIAWSLETEGMEEQLMERLQKIRKLNSANHTEFSFKLSSKSNVTSDISSYLKSLGASFSGKSSSYIIEALIPSVEFLHDSSNCITPTSTCQSHNEEPNLQSVKLEIRILGIRTNEYLVSLKLLNDSARCEQNRRALAVFTERLKRIVTPGKMS